MTELECTMYKTKPTLFVPVRFQSVSEALQTCDKFLPGSMADNFQVNLNPFWYVVEEHIY